MCHVLIIEDEALIAQLLRDVLEEAGATSFSFATTETEAIAAADDQTPAVITSDVKLLDGTGPRAVEAIHRNLGPVPVIFITATPHDCEPCPASARIVSKPFDREAMIQVFHELAPAG